ncbi:MAG: hypothetical protein ACKOJH_14015, partial [Actinomycetota bacterium]
EQGHEDGKRSSKKMPHMRSASCHRDAPPKWCPEIPGPTPYLRGTGIVAIAAKGSMFWPLRVDLAAISLE